MADLEGIELCNPHLDIHELFAYYNDTYFEGKLDACTVAWSSLQMTLAAGVCKFSTEGRCEIMLSKAVLKSCTTAELKKTLLHEMIHAYLFTTSGNKDHEDHGPDFQHLMRFINQCSVDDDQRPENGYSISISHNLEEELDVDQVHHWKCDKCGDIAERSRTQAPSASDCLRVGIPVPAGQSCPDLNCHWHMHEAKCGGAYQKTPEPAACTGTHKHCPKSPEANDPSDLSSPSMIGKKRPSVGPNSCTAKRVTVQNSTLENYFPAFEKGLDTNHESHFQAEKQVMDGGLTDKAIYANSSISVPRDHKEEIDSGKLKRKRPPRARNQGPNVPATETLPKSEMKGVATRKRGRPEGVQTAGKQEREPTVILAWKQWCMFEDEEDGETVGALINKRDERRLLEQRRKVVLQKQKTENAGVAEKTSAVKLDDGLLNSCSCTSPRDKTEVGITAGLLPGLTTVHEVHTGEYATRSNTFGDKDKALGGFSDFGTELAKCENNVGTINRINNDDRQGGSRDDHTKQLFSVEQQMMDLTNLSPLEESVVPSSIPVELVATTEPQVKSCNESMVQHPLCTRILVEKKPHGTDQRKGLRKGDTSCSERHMEELILDLDDDEESEAKKPILVSAQVTSVVDNEKDSMKGSNSTDNPNELLVNLPSTSRSQEECYQGCEPIVADNAANGVCEEQGESTGRLSDVVNQRGKQKVIELSDEEEDSNRVSIERKAISTHNSIQSLDDCNVDGGCATTSGIEISSVCLERTLGSAATKSCGAERHLFKHYNAGGGAVECVSPYLPGSLSSVEELKVKKHGRTYRRQKMQQGKAIAGDDSGEEVHGPVANTNNARSIGDIHCLQPHQLAEGGLNEAGSCPICFQTLPTGISNAELNSHIDQCLAHSK